MDFEAFLAKLFEFEALNENEIKGDKVVPRKSPIFAESWPDELDLSVRNSLLDLGIENPFSHQVNAIRKSLNGDVVLESPTASGKTLSFAAPMLHTLVTNPGTHAMMIYPMKALAFDQREQIRELAQPLGIESWTYDGDTDEEHKRLLRKTPPPILMTNPEYLNASFMGHRDKWTSFLSNLSFLVIDEMHEYRGLFGSNMALSLRRFFLLLHRLGASPRVFLSTATCENPKEHARNLTGRNVYDESASDALRPRRHFLFVQPDIPDYDYRRFLQFRIERVALAALAQDLQILIFCPSKRFLAEANRHCKAKADELGYGSDLVEEFHADRGADDKRHIQKRIKDGKIKVVFTTNALELGLDIGGLDGVVMAGFPSNIMSAWQQVGRAGRGWDQESFVLFYAMNDPIDRFFVNNIDDFLNRPMDQLVVNPDNDELIEKHLASLAVETSGRLQEEDVEVLGSVFYNKAVHDNARPEKGSTPQVPLSRKLRGGIGASYDLKIKQGKDKKIGQISEMRRFREAYNGAVFTFAGRKYRIQSTEADAVILGDCDQYLSSRPYFYTNIYQNPALSGLAYGDFEVSYGTLNFSLNFSGYKLVNERTGEEKFNEYSGPGHNQYGLHAVWFNVPQCNIGRQGIGALENLFRVGAMFVIPADRFDTSTWSKQGETVTSYYYENYEGGIGLARKLFDTWPTALKKGIEVAEKCSCQTSCQNCIEPAKSWDLNDTAIDKNAGLVLANRLLTAKEQGATHKLDSGRWIPI